MKEPILEPWYWRERRSQADVENPHHAIFCCSREQWLRIEAKHREILQRVVKPDVSVLDAGCGWGRLLELMPKEWRGKYVGIDLSPDFVQMARSTYPDRTFLVGDLRRIPCMGFDWAVLVSIRPMVRRNLGEDVWAEMETELRRVAKRLLYLEYDPSDEGSVE